MSFHLKTLAAALLAPLALSACIQLLPDPPPAPRIYPLEAGDVQSAARESALVASVARPTGPQILMGDGIVWRQNGVLAYMSGANWAGSAPELLQTLVAQTITRQGRLAAGVRAGDGLRGDVEVRWDLIAFEVVEEGGSLNARFAADVRVIQARGRTLLASEIVDVSEPLSDRSGGAAAQALARA
ncbi:MAG: ABC-type transport auxiliary lipoprotein family protein, partial [Hyphomonadaceae bacterium]